MHTTSIEAIAIPPNRQRQEFDPEALQELVESIRLNGLMHAPVMRMEEGKLILVAGERRLKAIQDLWMLGGTLRYNGKTFPEGSIPYVTLGELNPLEAEEAELDENLKRRDLTWQEHASAVQRLQDLRSAQKASAPAPSPQTFADTAEEIFGRRDGAYQATVRKECLVAKHLSDPEVAKAKTLDEGFKILKRKEQLQRSAALAELVGQTFSADKHQAFNMDCLKWMAEVSPEQFDVILTDPPYGMNAHKFDNAAGKLTSIEHHYDDSFESWQNLMQQWCPLAFRVAKTQAHAYVFCDLDNFFALREMMQSAGWYVFRTPFINVKTGSGRVPLPDRGPRRQYEICLYAIKGNKPVTHIYPDVIQTTADANEGHGAMKPIALYQNLLQRSVSPGDKVLDCFAGSGPIFPAAHTMKCEAVGVEMNPEYYGMCLKRLEALKDG